MLPDVVFEKEIAMLMHHNNKCVMICLLGTLLPTLVWASTDFNRPPRGERRRPPQEAFDACKGKTEGTSVTIATPHGNFKATCRNCEGSLAAVPEGAPPPQQGNDLKPWIKFYGMQPQGTENTEGLLFAQIEFFRL